MREGRRGGGFAGVDLRVRNNERTNERTRERADDDDGDGDGDRISLGLPFCEDECNLRVTACCNIMACPSCSFNSPKMVG